RVRLNEVLAANRSAVLHADGYPDLVELYNEGNLPVDLSGMGLTDDASDQCRFRFPAGTMRGGGEYLVVYADNEHNSGLHLGFGLKQSGETLSLFGTGGELLDSIAFGVQLADLSIGRLPAGGWGLTVPTFGGPNVAQPVGETGTLLINEWLANGATEFTTDYIELYS